MRTILIAFQCLLFIFYFNTVSAQIYQPNQTKNVTSGLVGYWKLNRENPPKISDSWFLGYHGTGNGNPQYSDEGKFDEAIQLDGLDDYIDLGSSNFGISSEITISVWVKINSIPRSSIYSIMERSQYVYPFRIQCDGNRNILACIRTVNGTNYFSSNSKIVLGQWQHIVLTYSSSEKKRSIYINGVLDYQNTLEGALNWNSGITCYTNVGRNPGGTLYFNGEIDDIRLFKRTLSGAEVADLYNGALPETDTQAPAIPVDVKIDDVLHNKVSLSWTPSTDDFELYGYNIYRDGNRVNSSATNSFTDDGLAQGTIYSYQVSAYDLTGNESSLSDPVTVTTILKPADWPTAYFTVEPACTVEVGDEVLFDASGSTDNLPIRAGNNDDLNTPQARFEWDFGDGYSMKKGVPFYYSDETGISCVHHFMKPGVYKVKLIMTDMESIRDNINPPHVDIATQTIVVQGEAPAPGFELLHAPFEARISQYIYAQIPSSLSGNDLKVTLKDDQNGYSRQLSELPLTNKEKEMFNDVYKHLPSQSQIGNPFTYRKFLLEIGSLSQDNYELWAEVYSGAARVSYIKEKFSKPYNGLPKVGIDKNNNYCLNGEPIFLLTPCGLNPDFRLDFWKSFINILFMEGFGINHDYNSWQGYLNSAQNKGYYAVGPEMFPEKGPIRNANRCANLNSIRRIVDQNKNHPALFGWDWDDEPNLGNWSGQIPAAVYASWDYVTRKLDYNHPGFALLYGLDYCSYYINRGNYYLDQYSYALNAPFFGGKRHFLWQSTGGDVYPIESSRHTAFNNTSRGPYDIWAEYVDNMSKFNYNLIPTQQAMEMQEILLPESPEVPTPEQIRMNAWLGVVHGVKGYSWFHYFGSTPPCNFSTIAEFKRAITDLTPIISSDEPDRIVTDDANSRGNRVDIMVKENKTDIYVFAVRVTEPAFDCISDGISQEADSISVQFQVENLPVDIKSASDCFDTYKSIIEYHGSASEGKSFTFNLQQIPVRPGTFMIAAQRTDTYFPWVYASDKGDGTISGTYDDVLISGSINYTTGLVSINFSQNIFAGLENLIAMYTPVVSNRSIQVINGKFTDTFKREAVHIYKISKSNTSLFPATLSDFTANYKNNKVTLNWNTVTEVNNYGFQIERMTTPDFVTPSLIKEGAGGGWEATGFVAGAGNSNSPKSYSFVDQTIKEGSNYLYRLKQIDNDGIFKYLDTVEVSVLSRDLIVKQNYPNPGNPATNIYFSIPKEGRVVIKIFNILGEEILTLLNENRKAGQHLVTWYGKDAIGGDVASGVYFYNVRFDNKSITKKMQIIR